MPDHEHAHERAHEHGADTNEAIWKSDIGVSFWKSTAEDRERRRSAHRALMADLLPFGADQAFCFVDLGAGTGAAARTVMDAFPRSRAFLADYSPQMMAQGEIELQPYAGRYEYVEFDLAHDEAWPSKIPAQVDAVISSMAIHHLADDRKRRLLREILERLAPSGWFLNYDPVSTADPVVQAAWHRVEDDDSRSGPRRTDARRAATLGEPRAAHRPTGTSGRPPARGGFRGSGRVLARTRLRNLRRATPPNLLVGIDISC
jgi:SAM-dependent methyltransferase